MLKEEGNLPHNSVELDQGLAPRGCIDSFDAGWLHGWFYQPGESDNQFSVAIDGVVIAQASAKGYRDDLQKAGFGDGHCAFRVYLPLMRDSAVGKSLTLVDAKGVVVEGTSFNIAHESGITKVALTGLEASQISFSMLCPFKSEHELSLCIEGQAVSTVSVLLESGTHQIRFALPSNVARGMTHTFSITTAGEPCLLWSGSLTLATQFASSTLLQSLPMGQRQEERACVSAKDKLNSAFLTQLAQKSLKDAGVALSTFQAAQGLLEKFTLPSVRHPNISVILPLDLPTSQVISFVASTQLVMASDQIEYIWISRSKESVKCKGLKVLRGASDQSDSVLLKQVIESVKSDCVVFLPAVSIFDFGAIEQLVASLSDPWVGFAIASTSTESGMLLDKGATLARGYSNALLQHDHPCALVSSEVDYSVVSACVFRAEQLKGISVDWQTLGEMSLLNYYQLQLRLQGLLGKHLANVQGVIAAEFQPAFYRQSLSLVTQPKFKALKQQFVGLDEDIAGQNLGTVVFIDAAVPKPDNDAGSYAALQEIKLVQSLGYRVVFIPLQTTPLDSYIQQMQKMGVEVWYYPYITTLGELLKNTLHQASAVYITRYHIASQVLKLVKQYQPDLPILFNNADLHFLRELRAAMRLDKDSVKREEAINQAKRTQQAELAVMQNVDVILSYNDTEHTVIASHLFEQDNIFTCPWVLEDKPQPPPFEGRHGIAFLGGYNHLPNVEAVEYFMSQVFPSLKQQAPDIQVYFYGSNLPAHFSRFEQPGVHFKGYIKDLADVYQRHRLFIAPLLSGAGVKGKVLDAAAYGQPCVLSPIAAESTGLSNLTDCYIAQTSAKWCEHIISLYHDKSTWLQFSSASQAMAQEQYSSRAGRDKMENVFKFLNLPVSSCRHSK